MDEKILGDQFPELKVIYVDSKITIATAYPSRLQVDVKRSEIEESFTESETTATNADDALAIGSPDERTQEQLSATINEYIEELQDDDQEQPLTNAHVCEIDKEIVLDGICINEVTDDLDGCAQQCLCYEDGPILHEADRMKECTAVPNDVSYQHPVSPGKAKVASRTAPTPKSHRARKKSLERESCHLQAVGESNSEPKEQKQKTKRRSTASSGATGQQSRKKRAPSKKRSGRQKAIQCVVKVGIRRPVLRKSKSMFDLYCSGTKSVEDPVKLAGASRKKARKSSKERKRRPSSVTRKKKSSKQILVLSMSANTSGSGATESESCSFTNMGNLLPEMEERGVLIYEPNLENELLADLGQKMIGPCKSQSFHGPFHYSSSADEHAVMEDHFPRLENRSATSQESLIGRMVVEEVTSVVCVDEGTRFQERAMAEVIHGSDVEPSSDTASNSSSCDNVAKQFEISKEIKVETCKLSTSQCSRRKGTAESSDFQKVFDVQSEQFHPETAKSKPKSKAGRKGKTKKLASKKRVKRLLTPDEKESYHSDRLPAARKMPSQKFLTYPVAAAASQERMGSVSKAVGSMASCKASVEELAKESGISVGQQAAPLPMVFGILATKKEGQFSEDAEVELKLQQQSHSSTKRPRQVSSSLSKTVTASDHPVKSAAVCEAQKSSPKSVVGDDSPKQAESAKSRHAAWCPKSKKTQVRIQPSDASSAKSKTVGTLAEHSSAVLMKEYAGTGAKPKKGSTKSKGGVTSKAVAIPLPDTIKTTFNVLQDVAFNLQPDRQQAVTQEYKELPEETGKGVESVTSGVKLKMSAARARKSGSASLSSPSWKMEIERDKHPASVAKKKQSELSLRLGSWPRDEPIVLVMAEGGKPLPRSSSRPSDVAEHELLDMAVESLPAPGGLVQNDTALVRTCSSSGVDITKGTHRANSKSFLSAPVDSEHREFQDCISITSSACDQYSEDEAFTADQWSYEDDGDLEDSQSGLEEQDDLLDGDYVYSSEDAVHVNLETTAPDTDSGGESASTKSSIPAQQLSYPAFHPTAVSNDEDDRALEAAQNQLLTATWSHCVHRPKWDATADLYICCEDQIFSVHRLVVVHFSKRICCLLYEGVLLPGRTLIVEGLSPTALKEVFDWMYSGSIDLQQVDILEVLLVALGLNMPALQELCTGLMAGLLPYFTLRQSLPEFSANAMAADFDRIVQENCFLDFTLGEVCSLLSYNIIKAECELHVYEAAVRWLTHNWPQRKGNVKQVMGCVRFSFLDTETVEQLVKRDVPDVAEKEMLSSRAMKATLQDALLFKCYNLECRLSACHHETMLLQRRFLCADSVQLNFADEVPSKLGFNATSLAKPLRKTEFRLSSGTQALQQKMSDLREMAFSTGTVVSESDENQMPRGPLSSEMLLHHRLTRCKMSVLPKEQSAHHTAKQTGARRNQPVVKILPPEQETIRMAAKHLSVSIAPKDMEETVGFVESSCSELTAVLSASKSNLSQTPLAVRNMSSVSSRTRTLRSELEVVSSHHLKGVAERDYEEFSTLMDADVLAQMETVGSSKTAVFTGNSEDQSKWTPCSLRRKVRENRSKFSSEVLPVSLSTTPEDLTQESEEFEINLQKSSTGRLKSKPHHARKGGSRRGAGYRDKALAWKDEQAQLVDGNRLLSDGLKTTESSESDLEHGCVVKIGSNQSAKSQHVPLPSGVDHIQTVNTVCYSTEYHPKGEEESLSDSVDVEGLLSSNIDGPPSQHVVAEPQASKATDSLDAPRPDQPILSYGKAVGRDQKHGLFYDKIGSDEVLTITKAKTATVTTFKRKSGQKKEESADEDAAASSERNSPSTPLIHPNDAEAPSHDGKNLPSQTTPRSDSFASSVSSSSLSSLARDSSCVLLFGGLSQPQLTENDSIVSVLHYYDAECEMWGGLSKLPEPRFDAAACLLGNGIYLAGGIDNRSINAERRSMCNLWHLDLQNFTWRELSSMPQKRSGHSLVALDNLVYAIGGAGDHHGNGLTSAVDVYNPRKDHWTSVPSLPMPLWKMAAASHQGNLWVCGGCTKSTIEYDGPAEKLICDVYIYKPKQFAWFVAPRLPQGRAMASLVEVSGQLILMGGITGSVNQKSVTGELTMFCREAETWCRLTNMSVPRCSFSAVTTGDKITILGGRNGQHGTPLSKVEMYDFGKNQWMDDLHPLPIPLSNCAAVGLANERNQRLLRRICP